MISLEHDLQLSKKHGVGKKITYLACDSRILLYAARAVRAAGVVGVYAPPAVALPHFMHVQIPTTFLLTASLPQNGHGYFFLWEISIFLIVLRSDAPQRTPYFPQMPTLWVLRAIVKGRTKPLYSLNFHNFTIKVPILMYRPLPILFFVFFPLFE